MINRRNFLKLIGIGTPALFFLAGTQTVKTGPLNGRDDIPTASDKIHSAKAKFDPDYEYGRAMLIDDFNENLVISRLHKDARRILPKGTPYTLRMMKGDISRGCPSGGCWYYSPRKFLQEKDINTKTWKYFPDYHIMGSFYA